MIKRPKLKTHHTEIESFLDKESGEVTEISFKSKTYISKTREEFFMIYAHIDPDFYRLSHYATKTFVYLCMNFPSDKGFEVGSYTRDLIADKLRVSNGTVANMLTELKKEEFLIQLRKGVYQINPLYAFKGGSSNRKSALKAVIQLGYNINDE